jgi:HEPN domain-containing protein
VLRVLAMLEKRGHVERIERLGRAEALICLTRARRRLSAAELLFSAEHWDACFISAYDAYRTAAESVVIDLGYRIPAIAGAHRITFGIALAALGEDTGSFVASTAERFRSGRHSSEYFDPDRAADKTEDDARWAILRSAEAVAAVASIIV